MFLRPERKKRKKLTAPLALKVEVGFPDGETNDAVIERATFNEFGTRTIPERPFMRNAMRANRGKYRRYIASTAKDVFLGRLSVRTALNRLGLVAVGDVQTEISTLMDPPNAPSTIAAKGSSNPLIDTGEMRQAVTYRVTK